MKCEQVKDLLSPYLDDQLTAQERQSVTSHLQVCAMCDAVLADYQRFDALLSQLPRLSPLSLQRGKQVGTTASLLVYEMQAAKVETPAKHLRSLPTHPIPSNSTRHYYHCRYPQQPKKAIPDWITTIPWQSKGLCDSFKLLLGLLTLGFSLLTLYYLWPKYRPHIPPSKEF